MPGLGVVAFAAGIKALSAHAMTKIGGGAVEHGQGGVCT